MRAEPAAGVEQKLVIGVLTQPVRAQSIVEGLPIEVAKQLVDQLVVVGVALAQCLRPGAGARIITVRQRQIDAPLQRVERLLAARRRF